MIITDGSASGETIYASQNCEWSISPHGAQSVYIFFNRFDIQGGALTIYSGSLSSNGANNRSMIYTTIANCSAVPAPILLTRNSFSIIYTSTKKAFGRGFSLTYFGVDNVASFPGDRIFRLKCSSVVSLNNALRLKSSDSPYILTWEIYPSSATTVDLFIAISALSLPSIRSCFEVFSGALLANTSSGVLYSPTTFSPSGPSLFRQCGPYYLNLSPYSWIHVSKAAVIKFTVENQILETSNKSLKFTPPNDGTFDISYYSDGSNQHCGFPNNPGIMTAPSMVFTDGSSSISRMYEDQRCEWIINPRLKGNYSIALEFVDCDMSGGAEIEVFDSSYLQLGANNLLWRCYNCSYIPRTIIAVSGSVVVKFSSPSRLSWLGPLGKGFKLVYWTIATTPTIKPLSKLDSNSKLKPTSWILELPNEYDSINLVTIDAALLWNYNNSESKNALFHLPIATSISTLQVHPIYEASFTSVLSSASSNASSWVNDGRPNDYPKFESLLDKPAICGLFSHNSARKPFLTVGSHVTYMVSQSSKGYLFANSSVKTIANIIGNDFPNHISTQESNIQMKKTLFNNAYSCAYQLDSGSNRAINIDLKSLHIGKTSRLIIYAGVYGHDAIVFDSQTASFSRDGLVFNVSVLASCGKALVLILSNDTSILSSPSSHMSNQSYSDFILSYSLDSADDDSVCRAYSKYHFSKSLNIKHVQCFLKQS